MKKRRLWLRTMALVVLSFISVSVNAMQIDQIIIFGDSLSDNGNIYALTTKTHKAIPAVPIVPKKPPYFEGRFSNGNVWVEDLAQALNVPLSDYAYAGSWAEPYHNSGLIFPFSLGHQVDSYLFMHGGMTDRHKEKHLYIVWSGANDYIQGREDHEEATTSTVENIRKNLDWLLYYGAKQVLVIDMPNLSVAPEIIAKGPEFVEASIDLVNKHNQKMAVMVNGLQEQYPDATIILGNVNKYMDDMIINPEKYGLTDTQHSCYGGGYWLKGFRGLQNNIEIAAAKAAKIDIMASADLRVAYMAGKMAEDSPVDLTCAEPDKHLFWDQIHPTKFVHKLIAKTAQDRLAESDIFGQ